MQYMDARVLTRQLVRQFSGAVGRIVVHYEHVHGDRQRKEPLRKRGEVLALIVGGDDDERFVHYYD